MANVATMQVYSTGLPAAANYDQVDNITTNDRTLFKDIHKISMNDRYHREDERLKTFERWPLLWLSKEELAQTGMFYTNEEDKVKCYFCEVEIGRWEHDDQPVPEHLKWSPNCPLLRRRTTNNVPLNSEALEHVLPPVSYDICGANDSIVLDRQAHTEGSIPMSHLIESTGVNTMSSVGAQEVVSTGTSMAATQALFNGDVLPQSVGGCVPRAVNGGTYYPEHPEYAIESARVRTFAEWPRNMKQKPQQLAEAGFFYTGLGDRVRCFSCGGGLKDWDDNDEPWEQHALWLGQCRFLKLIKGQLYIDTVAAVARAAKPAASSDSTPHTQVAARGTVSTAAQCCIAPGSQDDVTTAPSQKSAATRIYEQIVKQELASAAGSCSSEVAAAVAATAGSAAAPAVPEEKLCKICYAGEYNTAFLPCGHVVACAKCASSVTKCPLCRKPFTDVMRVYFS